MLVVVGGATVHLNHQTTEVCPLHRHPAVAQTKIKKEQLDSGSPECPLTPGIYNIGSNEF